MFKLVFTRQPSCPSILAFALHKIVEFMVSGPPHLKTVVECRQGAPHEALAAANLFMSVEFLGCHVTVTKLR